METNSKRKLLGIVMPTYNNPQSVRFVLGKFIEYFERGYEFEFIVCDSSTNDETQDIFKENKNENIIYFRVASGLDVDEKTLFAVKLSKADYVMLVGDGYLPKIDNIIEKINLKESKSEIIAVYDENWKPQRKYYQSLEKFEFEDKNEFFKCHFWQLILYGGSICRRELIEKIDSQKMVELYNKSGFIYPCSLACYSVGPYESKQGNFLDVNTIRKGSGWIRNKTAIKIWTKQLYEVLNSSELNLDADTRNYIIKTTGKRTGFLSAKGLLRFKASGNFTFKTYKKYKFYINQCKACSRFITFCIAIIPSFPLILMRKLYRSIKKIGNK